LDEDAGLGVFEDDVAEGVAFGDFFLDFGVEVVPGVFGFPVATDQEHLVFEGAVGADGFAGGFFAELGDECPVVGAGGVLEEELEGRGESAFVEDVLVLEIGEGGVVGVESFSERFGARGLWHGDDPFVGVAGEE
jgi:hypothetical protein